MKKIILALFAASLISCGKAPAPLCHEAPSQEESFRAVNGFNIGEHISRFVEIFPDTFRAYPYTLNDSIRFDRMTWVATVNLSGESTVIGITLTGLANREGADAYRREALALMNRIGQAQTGLNPWTYRMGHLPGITFISNNLTKLAKRVRICNGADYLLYTRATNSTENPAPLDSIPYETTFEIYDPQYYTPELLQIWPDVFPTQEL